MPGFAKRLANGSEITCIADEAVTPNDTRLIVGQRSGNIHVLQFDGQSDFSVIFAVRIDRVLPIAVSFAGSKGKEVHVYGMHDGIRRVNMSQNASMFDHRLQVHIVRK